MGAVFGGFVVVQGLLLGRRFQGASFFLLLLLGRRGGRQASSSGGRGRGCGGGGVLVLLARCCSSGGRLIGHDLGAQEGVRLDGPWVSEGVVGEEREDSVVVEGHLKGTGHIDIDNGVGFFFFFFFEAGGLVVCDHG